MDAILVPDYSKSNPYQRELTDGLSEIGISTTLSTPRGVFPLTTLLFEEGTPDVLHLHWTDKYLIGDNWVVTSIKGIRLLFELVLFRILGVRIVWTIHNQVEHHRRTPRTEVIFKHLLVRFADAAIVHCESAIDIIRSTYRLPRHTRHKFHVAPHGHYIEAYGLPPEKDWSRAELGIPEDSLTFLYFGRIEPYKNVPELARLFRMQDREDIRLIIAGNPGSDAIEDELLRISGSDDRIDLRLSYIPDEELPVLLSAADVLVCPFEEILTSGSVVLGMSFGKAVIAPRQGCVGSLLGDSPLTYDDDSGLHAAMVAATIVDLEQIGADNLEKIRRADWGSIAATTASIYRGRHLTVG